MTTFLLEFTVAMTGASIAINPVHVVSIFCSPVDGQAIITTAEHVEGVHVLETYEYVRDRLDEALRREYPEGVSAS